MRTVDIVKTVCKNNNLVYINEETYKENIIHLDLKNKIEDYILASSRHKFLFLTDQSTCEVLINTSDICTTIADIQQMKEKGFIVLKSKETCSLVLDVSLPSEDQLSIMKACFESKLFVTVCYSFKEEVVFILDNYTELAGNTESTSSDISVECSAHKFVMDIIYHGIDFDASDLHLEPTETGFRTRLRIDGILVQTINYDFSRETCNNITNEIKKLAGVSLEPTEHPIDGLIRKISYKNRSFDLRVSVMYTVFGPKTVLRIVEKGDRLKTLEELGFPETERDHLSHIISNPSGIMIIAGATGSGKSTTMYSCLDFLNKPSTSICSVENPVEREMDGIAQISLKTSTGELLPLQDVLDGVLRQDNDVISIGEIRNIPDADMCLRAALTGHLVLATLHANAAIDTLGRLYDMKMDPYILSTTISGLISQRLVRVVCKDCAEERKANDNELRYVEYINKKYNKNHSIDRVVYGRGCPNCSETGYKGRTIAPEVAVIEGEFKSMIFHKESVAFIQARLLENGFHTFEYNAFLKAEQGITTIDEVVKQIGTRE